MSKDNPLVSIIVRTKDRPELLKRALQSIAAQTYRPIEVILVNDGGCDLDIEELKNILGDVSLNYQRLGKNTGRAHAGNVGIANSQGEYIGFLDDDDMYYPDHVETLVNALRMTENYGVAYTDSKYIFEEVIADKYVAVHEQILYSKDFDRVELLIANYIPLINVMCNKDLVNKAGLFHDEFEAHEDWDLWIRLSQYTDFYHIKKVTAAVSTRADGTTLTSSNRSVFLKTARMIHERYSPFVEDERILESQRLIEWALSKEVVAKGEKLENADVMGIAESLIQEKDNRMQRLEAEIQAREGKIASLEAEIQAREGKIASLEAEIQSKNAHIMNKNAHIMNIEAELRGKETTLNGIYGSHGWRALLVYYRVRDWLLPSKSRRRQAVKFVWSLLNRSIMYLMSGMRKTAVAIEDFPRVIVSFYSSSSIAKRGFAALSAISYRHVRPILPALHDKIFVDFKLYFKKRWLCDGRWSGDSERTELYSLPRSASEGFYPKVSVIIPNYNHGRYLRQRLDSVYGQTYKNIEVILLDDGSVDEGPQILEEYRSRYPEITRYYRNDRNSGSAFHQWRRGIELAEGQLIWIAESDDYCSPNLLKDLVPSFAHEAVMLAFCKTVFIEGETGQQVWSLEEYLSDLTEPATWRHPFVKSAHHLVNTLWGIRNIVPNVSSAVFRNQKNLALLEDDQWKQMRICGDWIYYLHVVRGGLVAYHPSATNFFRLHKKNTSVNTYKQDIYYREHEIVAEHVVRLYRINEYVFEKLRSVLELHWRLHRLDYSESRFRECFDCDRIRHLSELRKPNILMVTYALSSGGGETFPIKLSNLLKMRGYCVTLLNCHREPSQLGIRRMLDDCIPLLELERWDKLNAVVDDMGVEIVHSHHAWVDVTVCSLLEGDPHCKVVVTNHGMYDMMTSAEIERIVPLLNKRVNKFVCLSEKNIRAFESIGMDEQLFITIGNAIERVPILPISRAEMAIPDEAFVLCIVSRAIPEKGWEEGIGAVELARELCGKDVHLLLVGEGPEYDRLRRKIKDHFVHFLGFRGNVRDYFAASDLGFLPSRFKGETFPLVVIECLQANRPVLASDVGEIAKMLETESGLAGTVFPLNNWKLPVKVIAEIIAEYATNDDLYAEHIRRVSAAVKKFDPEKMLEGYELVYQELVGNEGQREKVLLSSK